jgi:hypothetical protein
MAEFCVPVCPDALRGSRLVEVAVIPSSTPRFSLSTVTSLTCFSVLLHHCNTRYEWLVRPCSAETCTLQETPSFAWRTNGLRLVPDRGYTLSGHKLCPVAWTWLNRPTKKIIRHGKMLGMYAHPRRGLLNQHPNLLQDGLNFRRVVGNKFVYGFSRHGNVPLMVFFALEFQDICDTLCWEFYFLEDSPNLTAF